MFAIRRSLPLARSLASAKPTNIRNLSGVRAHIYTAKAVAEGPGRLGTVKSEGGGPRQEDGSESDFELTLARPKIIGGKGNNPNPEQLLAMGYSACFLQALQLCASKAGQTEVGQAAKVHATVYLGHPEDEALEGFALSINISVEGVEDDAIILAAHELCPYSRAFKTGVKVNILKK